jgi:eukaryotic-like serine/threonine-protein kinase
MLSVLDVGIHLNDRVGNYRVVADLGPTGLGVLLQVEHLVLPRRAILKVVHAAFASVKPFAVQTLREACILEAIAHPGVPVVYESGVLRDRRPWFAFEMISGPTLEDRLADGPLAVDEVTAMVRDVVDVLAHAHRRGVIHRGLRPERIVFTPERRYPLCIPDWSEAIAHDATTHTPFATWDGAQRYVAPELAVQLADGSRPHIDDRVDMFALGVIAYRALTGQLPFDAAPSVQGVPHAPYVPALERRPDASPELATLIDSLLAFDRFDRPSALEARAAIDWVLGAGGDLPRLAAASGPHRREPLVVIEPRRSRQPRWTPEIHYPETTEVDIQPCDDGDGLGTG